MIEDLEKITRRALVPSRVSHMGRAYLSVSSGGLDPVWNFLVALRNYRSAWRFQEVYGRYPNYFNPRSFAEKLQARKLFDRNPRFPIFCDKLAARDYVRKIAPELSLPRLLWSGEDPDAIPLEELDAPFVIKPNNRSRAILFVRSRAELDSRVIRETCRDWLAQGAFAQSAGEWGYQPTKTRIMVEEFLSVGPDLEIPADYKIFVFHGRVRFIYFSAGRHSGGPRRRGVYARDWTMLPYDKRLPKGLQPLEGGGPRPDRLEAMLEAAERIAAGLDFLRVDLYALGERLVFGEGTVYPYSGYSTFVRKDAPFSRSADEEIGAYWTLPAIPVLTRLYRGLLA
jgi:TupA-like ATPgrasp